MTFNAGDRVRIDHYGSSTMENTRGEDPIVGVTGTVIGHDGIYVLVNRDNSAPYSTTRCLASELEFLPDEPDEFEFIDSGDYAIRYAEDAGAFEFFHKETNEVLLFTQFVSLDTLIRLTEDHANRP